MYRDDMSRALRDIAVPISRWNDISARFRREAPISREIIVVTYVSLTCAIFRQDIGRTKSDIGRLSFALHLHASVLENSLSLSDTT